MVKLDGWERVENTKEGFAGTSDELWKTDRSAGPADGGKGI